MLELRDPLLVSRRDTADEPIANVGLANPGLQTFRPLSELMSDPLHGPARGAEFITKRPHETDSLCLLLR